MASEKEIARTIYTAWMKDERWQHRHIEAPRAYFWAQLAAKAILTTSEDAAELPESSSRSAESQET